MLIEVIKSKITPPKSNGFYEIVKNKKRTLAIAFVRFINPYQTVVKPRQTA
jgi:hypothetical protein